MPGAFGGKYQGPTGAVLAYKDSEVQALIKNVKSFKAHLERIMLCIDELSGTYRDLCVHVGTFYENDPGGLANDVTEGYKRVTESMANVVPRKVNEILRTKVVKSCDEWIIKLEAVRAAQDSQSLLETANKVAHYLDKVDRAKDASSIARNQGKLSHAQADYDAVAEPILKDMDAVLIAQKAEYSKLVVRVMQFQQAYFKQAFSSCEMMPLMDSLRDLVERNAWESGESERLCQSAQHAAGGRASGKDEDSDEDFDSSDDDILSSGPVSSSAKKPSPAVQAFNKLADDLEEMFWGGRTPRERDLTAMKDAMYELNSKLLSCPKTSRKELRARIDSLDMKWKQAVDVHMKLGLTQGKQYKGGIQKPGQVVEPSPEPVQAGPDISSISQEHLAMLQGDPSLAPEFDQMYGDGAAAKLLGIAPRSVAAVEISPSDEHVEMLLSDPSLAPKFDSFYGDGAAARTLEKEMSGVNGVACEPSPEPSPDMSAIPPEHADMLHKDPSLVDEFDRMYGAGAANKVLAQEYKEPEYNAPSDHVGKLRQDPSLAPRFDIKYGIGAAQYYLGGTSAGPEPTPLNMMANTLISGEMYAAQHAKTKEEAIQKYQDNRSRAASHDNSMLENAMVDNSVLMDTSQYNMLSAGAMGDMPAVMGGGMMSPYNGTPMVTPMGDMPGGIMQIEDNNALGCYSEIPVYNEPPYQEQEPSYQETAVMEQPPPEHLEMLYADPGFAQQFDEVYGAGRSQYYLNQHALNAVHTGSSDYSSAGPSPMVMSSQPQIRESFDYTNDQDSDEDIIYTAPPVTAMMQLPPSLMAPTVVSDFEFFPEDATPAAAPQAVMPPMELAPAMCTGNPEDSESPRSVRWRSVNQQRVAMGLPPKPHPGAKV